MLTETIMLQTRLIVDMQSTAQSGAREERDCISFEETNFSNLT